MLYLLGYQKISRIQKGGVALRLPFTEAVDRDGIDLDCLHEMPYVDGIPNEGEE